MIRTAAALARFLLRGAAWLLLAAAFLTALLDCAKSVALSQLSLTSFAAVWARLFPLAPGAAAGGGAPLLLSLLTGLPAFAVLLAAGLALYYLSLAHLPWRRRRLICRRRLWPGAA